jgi:hypothetical protein
MIDGRASSVFLIPNAVLLMDKEENDIMMELPVSIDNGGRRSGGDRRNYSYSLYIPERRRGIDRREGEDRRKSPRLEE